MAIFIVSLVHSTHLRPLPIPLCLLFSLALFIVACLTLDFPPVRILRFT